MFYLIGKPFGIYEFIVVYRSVCVQSIFYIESLAIAGADKYTHTNIHIKMYTM